MFNQSPQPPKNVQKESSDEDKFLGFPSDKLGDDENTIREIFGKRLIPSEIYSMLLVLLSKNAVDKNPAGVLSEYTQSNLTKPSEIKMRDYIFLESLMFSLLDDKYEAIALSPLTPAGTSSVVNNLDPKTMLQTIKNTELVADASVVLALESAKRRKGSDLKTNISEVNLATSQREVRMQKFKDPNFSPHYSSFTITSASRDLGRYDFEKKKLAEHIDYFLSLLVSLRDEHDYDIKDMFVEISDISILERMIGKGLLDRRDISRALRTVGSLDYFSEVKISLPNKTDTMQGVILDEAFSYLEVPIKVLNKFEEVFLDNLKLKFPDVKFIFRLDRSAGIGYFNGPCYKIRALNSKGEVVPIVDGGSSDWTGKFLSDSSERFFGSGIGSDVLIKKFNKNYE